MISKYLYARDSKGKVRVLVLDVYQERDIYGNENGVWNIGRRSGILAGSLISQPTLVIKKGKAGRTVQQQVELQVNSIISKQRDKGYKLLAELTSGDVDPNSYDEIDRLLPTLKTHINGMRKLMLAKDPKPGTTYFKKAIHSDKLIPTDKWNKMWLASRKLDGIRASVILKNGSFTSMSRTGKSLDVAFTSIFQESDLMVVADAIGLDKVIDGELYKHGLPLQKITGIAALKDYVADRHDQLEFWIFDYADDTTTAWDRTQRLNALIPKLKGRKIKINIHTAVTGYAPAKVLHDKWVHEGYEGAILRDPDGLYGFGKRDDRMLKLKEFQDDEFEIIGHKLGLRGAEDMCFILKTEDGKEFEAKPIGDRQMKLNYVADMPNLLGKQLTVKFFNYTQDGIPNLPCGVAVRDYE